MDIYVILRSGTHIKTNNNKDISYNIRAKSTNGINYSGNIGNHQRNNNLTQK